MISFANIFPARRRPVLGLQLPGSSPINRAIFEDRTEEGLAGLFILQLRFFSFQLFSVAVLLRLFENAQLDYSMPSQHFLIFRAEPREPHANGRNGNLRHGLLVHPLIENAGGNRQKMQDSFSLFVHLTWPLPRWRALALCSTAADCNHKFLKDMLVGVAELHAGLHGLPDGRSNHVDHLLLHVLISLLVGPVFCSELPNGWISPEVLLHCPGELVDSEPIINSPARSTCHSWPGLMLSDVIPPSWIHDDRILLDRHSGLQIGTV
mmetsp:Transcript_89144/g.238790  ORF Transcript_89144/g.238790 Transcript_89144/m.238790 type:complete len:265 (+) Transcript_89144:1347-2141(+)